MHDLPFLDTNFFAPRAVGVMVSNLDTMSGVGVRPGTLDGGGASLDSGRTTGGAAF